MRSLLADLILVLHFAIAGFIAVGLAAIWVGFAAGWTWIRNRAFRIAHLVAIGFVALESIFGIACPLTVWEYRLRGIDDERGFVSRWVARALYYDLPEAAFTVAYLVATAATLAAWRLVPPRRRNADRAGESRSSAQADGGE